MGMIRMALGAVAMLLLAGCVGYGYPAGGGYDGYARYPGGGHHSSGGYHGAGHDGSRGRGATVRCESDDHRSRRCSADTRGGVMIARQLSRTQCVQGSNWGWDNAGIWVSGGCRAEFVTGRGGYGNGGAGRPGAAAAQLIRCESDRNRYRHCGVQVRRDVQLSRQLSKTQCVRGRNWDWDRNGVWVDHGCRAEFSVR